jgi:hypothetical protein
MYLIRVLAIAVLSVSLAGPTAGYRIVNNQSRSAQPIKTINRGRAKVFYYENPKAVAVATSFYVIGSQKNSLWRDFMAITANFVVPGPTITSPRFVQLHFAATTRTKGGKYGSDHRLTILTDGKLLLSTDLEGGPAVDNRRGRYMEVFDLPQMTFEQFSAIAEAKQVRMTLGPTKFKLKNEHLEPLRNMLESIGS